MPRRRGLARKSPMGGDRTRGEPPRVLPFDHWLNGGHHPVHWHCCLSRRAPALVDESQRGRLAWQGYQLTTQPCVRHRCPHRSLSAGLGYVALRTGLVRLGQLVPAQRPIGRFRQAPGFAHTGAKPGGSLRRRNGGRDGAGSGSVSVSHVGARTNGVSRERRWIAEHQTDAPGRSLFAMRRGRCPAAARLPR
jgi:hypothetical protein